MKKPNSLIKSILSSVGEDILCDFGEITLEAVAKIVARLFAALIDGKIGYDSFCRYSQVVNNSYLNDSGIEFFGIIKEKQEENRGENHEN